MSKLVQVLPGVLLAVAVCAQENNKNVLDKFPDAEGKEEVTTTCSACHALSRVSANHRTQAQWAQTVKVHEGRGLKLEADEAAPIIKYLAAYCGPMVNINNAPEAEIADLPGVTKKMAAAVVQYRREHGLFPSAEGLDKVEGFDATVMAKIRNRVSTGEEPKAEGA